MGTKRYALVLLLASVVFAENFIQQNDQLHRLMDPFVPGDLPVNHTAYRQVLNLFLDTNIDVYAPNATGNFPVLYFATGFGAIIPAEAHTILLSSIASHGVVVVAVWKLGSPEDSFNPEWFEATVDFVENRLENSLHNQEGYVSDFHVDCLHSFISGHSGGSHVAVSQLQTNCLHYQGLILLDAVDGNNPIPENITMYVITPGQKVNFTIPTLQIVTGLDPVVGPYGLACAPEELSGRRFFDAMTGPTWYVNATAYGHADLMDPIYVELNEVTQFCPSDPNVPKEEYIQFLTGEIISFMNGVLEPVGNCALFDYLETSGLVGINTENDYVSNGWDRCTPLQCVLTPSSYSFFSSFL
uniref:Arylacetamide deacetylase n=1 Tax=Daphnia magna TaxID=35525 RepID=A0A0P6DNC3_9CRUS